MNSVQRLVIVALVGLAFIAGSVWQFAGAQGEQGFTRHQWEYTTAGQGTLHDRDLNKYGAEGWELVGLTTYGERNDLLHYVFKRRSR